MKNTTKKTKPAFIVDLTKAETCDDIKFEFVRGKAKAGIKLTDNEIQSLVRYGADTAFELIDECFAKLIETTKPVIIEDDKLVKDIIGMITKKVAPKTPWYKKTWNWLKKPFTKKK